MSFWNAQLFIHKIVQMTETCSHFEEVNIIIYITRSSFSVVFFSLDGGFSFLASYYIHFLKCLILERVPCLFGWLVVFAGVVFSAKISCDVQAPFFFFFFFFIQPLIPVRKDYCYLPEHNFYLLEHN